MRFGADDLAPILGIAVAVRHNNADCFLPIWTQFQNAPVDFYGNGAAVSDDHRFSRQEVCAILFVMFNNIPAERINRGCSAKHALHLTQHFLALFNGCSVCLFLEQRIGFVNFPERILIQFQVDARGSHSKPGALHRPPQPASYRIRRYNRQKPRACCGLSWRSAFQ